ncbi:claudin-20 [Echinops telfairi]|uniref:Claudin n=1 Tax=Echinops telfairi TaxID=9371 RepID=A0ABM0ZQ71_ECHTE|nr:claudin-20 [Echinops telfairi]
MASAGLQLFAFSLALLGVSGVLMATLLPTWKVHVDPGSNVLTAITQLQGLWADCTWYSTGMFSCTLKYSVLSLPTLVRAARAMMVLACVLSALGVCVSTVGMACTRLGGNRKTKERAALTGGVCFLSAGGLGLLPVGWYTKEIVADSVRLAGAEGRGQEPGSALYVGFAAAVLLCLSGMIFCLSCAPEGSRAGAQPPLRPDRSPTTRMKSHLAYHLQDYV